MAPSEYLAGYSHLQHEANAELAVAGAVVDLARHQQGHPGVERFLQQPADLTARVDLAAEVGLGEGVSADTDVHPRACVAQRQGAG